MRFKYYLVKGVVATVCYYAMQTAYFPVESIGQQGALLLLLGLFLMAIGYGCLFERIVGRSRREGLGISATIGIALFILIGGVLNALSAIAPNILRGLVILGVAAGVVTLIRQRTPRRILRYNDLLKPNLRSFFVVLTFALLALHISASLEVSEFNPHDDLQAYLAYPIEMLQTGSISFNPLSERRMFALGGQSFLHAAVLSFGGFSNLSLIEPALPLTLLFLILVAEGRRKRVKGVVVSFALTILLLTPWIGHAITSVTTSILFLTAMLVVGLAWLEEGGAIYPVVTLALLSSALISLKSTMVPVAALLLAAIFIGRCYRSGICRARFKEAILFVAVCLLSLTPWMYSLWLSNATPLFPFLGKGLHGSVYGPWFTAHGESLTTLCASMLATARHPSFIMALLCMLLLLKAKGGALKGAIFGTLLLSALILGAKTQGVSRYAIPLMMALIPLALIHAGAGSRRLAYPWTKVVATLHLGIVAILIVVLFHTNRSARPAAFLNLLSDSARYRALQASIPAGETLLVRLEKNFLLDFRRNKILIVDQPGGSSWPPGIPLSNAEELRSYLLRHDVHYLAYAYASEANHSRTQYGARVTDPQQLEWIRITTAKTFEFQDTILALARRSQIVYDDHRNVVVSLR